MSFYSLGNITDSCEGEEIWGTHMKTGGIISFVGLVLMVTAAHAAPISIDSRGRVIAASVGGPGTTNFTNAALGLFQSAIQESNMCGCVPFPGYGFNLEADASQNTRVQFLSNGVLSITGRGDIHALTTLTVANEYGAVAASSKLDVQFTIDQPLAYSVTSVLSFPVGKAYVYLLRKSGTNAFPVFAFGRTYFDASAPSTGGSNGVLKAGSYQFVAGVEGGAYALSGNGSFDTAFTVSPPTPPPAPPTPSITKMAQGLALTWPMSGTNALLETTPSLTSPVVWTTSTNAVTQSNGFHTVTIDQAAPSQFFRLRTL